VLADGPPRDPTEGDTLTLTAIYDRFGQRIFRLARRRLGDAGEAEDVVQDVLLKLWQARAAFDARRGDLPAWIFSITRNTVYDRLRRAARLARRQQAAAPLLCAEGVKAGPEALEAMMAREGVKDLLMGLPPAQRAIVCLVVIDARTVAEAARLLGVPHGTAKSRLRSALRSLRARLAVEARSISAPIRPARRA